MANEEIDPLVRQALVEILDAKHRHERRRRQPVAVTPQVADHVAVRRSYWIERIAETPSAALLVDDQAAFEQVLRALATQPGIGLDEAAIIRSLHDRGRRELREALERGGQVG